MNNIKQVVQDQGRLLKWVASELGVNEGTFYHWCQNRRQPNIFQLKKVAEFLGVTMEELIS